MQITIYRGFRQIGGCITEISSKAGTKIIIDLGHNLPGTNDGKDELANRKAVKELTKGCSAILYTHYHEDHVGLFPFVPSGITQYIGSGAKEVMICKYTALVKHENKYKKALDKIASFDNYQMAQELHIGDITITPFLVSHSAFDAYMFLIKADGKTILHTGDYRDHSYLGKGLMKVIKKYIVTQNVDVIITEGTMLSRESELVKHENELLDNAVDLLRKPDHKFTFVLCSSTDMEHLATLQEASNRANRLFIVDGYQKAVLDIFTKYSGNKSDLFNFSQAKVNTEKYDDFFSKGFCMPVRLSMKEYVGEMLARLHNSSTQSSLMYSMWKGYIKKGAPTYNPKIQEMIDMFGGKFDYLHTSGHATKETIREVCEAVNPTTAIIPIHRDEKSELDAAFEDNDELLAKIIKGSTAINDIIIDIKLAC